MAEMVATPDTCTPEKAMAIVGTPTEEWRVYTTAKHGDVSSQFRSLEAAMVLYDEGLAVLAQRRTAYGIEYLMKASKWRE